MQISPVQSYNMQITRHTRVSVKRRLLIRVPYTFTVCLQYQ